jgi:hypothetical protein
MTMRTALAALAAAVAALAVLAPAADAKEVMSLQVCVPAGCHRVSDPGSKGPAVIEGVPAAAPTRAAPFVRLRVGVGDGKQVMETFTSTFVPRAGLIQSVDGSWIQPDPDAVATLRDLTRGLELFPASRLRLPDLPSALAAPPASEVGPADDGGGLPAWLLAVGVALLGAAAVVPVVRARKAAAGS